MTIEDDYSISYVDVNVKLNRKLFFKKTHLTIEN